MEMNFPHSVYLLICSSAGVPTTSVLDSEGAPSTVTAADPGEPTGDVAAACEDKTRYNWTRRQSNLLNCKLLIINYITNAFAIKKKHNNGLINMFLIFWPFSDCCSISFCFHSATPNIPVDRPLPFPFVSHLGGWIVPLPVVFAGFPCSIPSTCRWCGGYRRNRIPWCKALAPGSGWSPEPCCDGGARGMGEDIPGRKQKDGSVIMIIRGLLILL